jgi:hypothetical protein
MLVSLGVGQVPSRKMLVELQEGWGNEGFAARTDYLEEVAQRAATVTGPILECGSGLSTIILGCLAGRRGIKTWSLEHVPEWRDRVVEIIQKYQIPHVNLCLAPLRDYDGYAWYEPPLEKLPASFELVICDGPPGTTSGNRYGLLPLLRERLGPGAVILLDDADRIGEKKVIFRWVSEASLRVDEKHSPSGAYARLTVL